MAAIQDIRVSNNTSASVTISWITDEETGGQVRYGAQSDLSDALVAYDTRGEAFEGCTHYVVIANLQPETGYYFEVISNGEVDNNQGRYYSCKTMKVPSAPPGTCLYYGYVYHRDGTTPAEGALVFARLTHAGVDSYPLSELVGTQGSFLFTVREARSTATDDLFSYTNGDPLRLEAMYCGDATARDLSFAGCASSFNCGSMLLGSSSSTSVSSTASTSVPVGPTTTTTVVISSSSSTTPSTVTSTSIPVSLCEVMIDPPTLTLRPFRTFQFTAQTICNGYAVDGRYRWSIDSAKGSSIGGEGMFRAGAVAETVAVTAVDIDHEEIAGTATVTVAALWPRVYEELWGEVRAENLAVMRTFRDTVMADREWGRNAITLLYDNSAELAVLLLYHPLLRREARDMAGMMIPDMKLLLAGKSVTITRSKKARLVSCIDAFAREAFSPQLQSGLGQIREDVTTGAAFKQFGIE
jgi:hypothetical protein